MKMEHKRQACLSFVYSVHKFAIFPKSLTACRLRKKHNQSADSLKRETHDMFNIMGFVV